ncbi:hypothetical protein [Sphingomonas hylomeconis]|uniref:Uncharacterized protein n=1 Tax=Sphingomonas hylomeconis TaxID=1395958 RepID=A0ABV7SZS7_9SPHN|nr:hypothetical protein [Sphingomonas hylomeconis]
MNAITSIGTLAANGPFDDACRRVNEWRGRCMHALSCAEDAVTKCLVVLAQVPDRGLTVRLQHLIGQRYDALCVAVAADGAFAHEGRAASVALQSMLTHATFRNEICHGVAKVAVDRSDRWVLVLRTTTLRANRMERSTLVVEEAEGAQQLIELIRASRDLCSKLGMLRKQFEPTAGISADMM